MRGFLHKLVLVAALLTALAGCADGGVVGGYDNSEDDDRSGMGGY